MEGTTAEHLFSSQTTQGDISLPSVLCFLLRFFSLSSVSKLSAHAAVEQHQTCLSCAALFFCPFGVPLTDFYFRQMSFQVCIPELELVSFMLHALNLKFVSQFPICSICSVNLVLLLIQTSFCWTISSLCF